MSNDAFKQRRDLVRRVLGTESGQQLLKLLEETFNPPEIRGADPLATYFALGQRDVVMYLSEAVRDDR